MCVNYFTRITAALILCCVSFISDYTISHAHAEGFGTAWYVTPTDLVTAGHVVDGYRTVTLVNAYGDMAAGVVVAFDYNKDLALIRTTRKAKPLKVANKKPILAESVFIYAYDTPDAFGKLHDVIVRGYIARESGPYDNKVFYQLDAFVRPGMSGSPVMDRDGFVIGVTVSRMIDGLWGASFATTYDMLRAFLTRHGVQCENDGTITWSAEDMRTSVVQVVVR